MRKYLFILFIVLSYSITAATIQSNGTGDWNNAATWIGGVIPGQNDNIEIVNGHAITLNANAAINNIIITDGTISIGSYSISVYGNISGQTNNISSTANSTLDINDNGSASIFDVPTNISKLKKLSINRSAGMQTNHSIDLDDAVPADSIVLVLTNGILYMNSGSIFYMNSQAIKRDIPCSDISHIDGPVQRDIKANSGFHVFPIGDNGLGRPMALAAQNGINNINQVQFIYATPPNNMNINTSKLPGGIFQNFYWNHQLISSSNTQRRIYFEDSDFPGITDAEITDHVYLANSDGIVDWNIPTTPRSVDITNNWISFDNSNASNDGYWTFGSDNISVQIDEIILPIELLYFEVVLDFDGIYLEWATASETNNEFFEIERSYDGITFESISTINGGGTSYNSIHYQYIDNSANQEIVYYRLKQIDFNGAFSFSHIVSIENKYNKIICNLLPTKQNIWECKIKGNKNSQITYKVISTNGNQLLSNTIDLKIINDNKFSVDLNQYAKDVSVVFIVIFIDNESFQYKIYIQH